MDAPERTHPDPDKPRPAVPTWIMRVRQPGAVRWEDRRIEARSVLRAEAILRRAGLEVDAAACRRTDRPPESLDDIRRLTPGPLLCQRCGYALEGLIVRQSLVECPECGFGQVVLAYVPETGVRAEAQARGNRPPPMVRELWRVGIGCLALIGTVVVLLVAFSLLMNFY
jgi:DNA-directed RNA polymerase subunit RPC12/RpoP